MTEIRFDKEGRAIPPTVKLGNERLSKKRSMISGDGFVLCDTHSVVPVAWVRQHGTLVKVCRHCVRQFCPLSTAVLVADLKPPEEHSVGHS